jgi:hypothetical protein
VLKARRPTPFTVRLMGFNDSSINESTLMNWMIPVIRWAQAEFLLILNQLVVLASLLFVPNLLG